MIASPMVFTTRPPAPSISGNNRLLWRLIIAIPSTSPFFSKYVVEPLMSLKRMVTGVRSFSSSSSAWARASSSSPSLSLSKPRWIITEGLCKQSRLEGREKIKSLAKRGPTQRHKDTNFVSLCLCGLCGWFPLRPENVGVYLASTGGSMNRRTSISLHRVWFQSRIFAAALLGAVLPPAAPVHAATACEKLASLALPNAKIDSAQTVAAGAFAPPAGRGAAPAVNPFAKLPAFCRVTATLTPNSDSDIKTEIWLPASGWNVKFHAVGNGGCAGTTPYPTLAGAVAAGYAGAGTDTGHVGNNAEFALGHPEKIIDIAYRSIHEMTVQSKTIINAHYGMPAKLSYYNGCSQGGRQGLAAAQKYPEDFNGIIAGAAAWNQMRAHGARTALNLIVNKDADSIIPPSKYSMIHEAVLNACDALDGLKDGIIENPMTCNFDYVKLACNATCNQE